MGFVLRANGLLSWSPTLDEMRVKDGALPDMWLGNGCATRLRPDFHRSLRHRSLLDDP
jgi:hypothetical protein